MMIGNRTLGKNLSALFKTRHYRALWNMATLSDNFMGILTRYLLNKGSYPFTVRVKTPIGRISVITYSHHDVLTVNEIFFRKDYHTPGDGENSQCVIDIGANIGISALYFLTRNRQSRAYLFEPDPRNVEKLLIHTKPYMERVVVEKKAISNYTGTAEFAIEDSGRYGGIGRDYQSKIEVECVHINEALTNILKVEKNIDILKIDTEGLEFTILDSIDPGILAQIGVIFYEKDELSADRKLNDRITSTFRTRKYGPIRILTNAKQQRN